jgi:general L-amino acid transport system permease protein
MSNTAQATNERPPFWRDERILAIITQVLVVTIVIGALLYFYSNMVSALKEQMGVAIDFGFLKQTAGFDIGESLIEYSRQDTYARAFMVGLLNTLQIAFLGIIFTTILGIIIGVMRLSSNWLISRIAMVYIELFRNIPLLVLLIFWAQAVFFKLPRIKEALILFDPYFPVYLSNRGIATPWGIPSETWATFLLFLVGGLILAIIVAILLVRHGRKTGRMPFVSLWFVVTWLAVAIFGWFFLSMTNQQPLSMTKPALEGLNTKGGRVFSQQFMALLSGLVLYTAAFVAEVVRAGIQSVGKGQKEAATALGLGGFQTLRLIVFPQALRVIIPPLTSQYLNLTKNSSLAIAIGYPDLFAVAGNTILNQTGRAIEVFTLVMGVYLAFSLITSLLMNIYNKRIQLVER